MRNLILNPQQRIVKIALQKTAVHSFGFGYFLVLVSNFLYFLVLVRNSMYLLVLFGTGIALHSFGRGNMLRVILDTLLYL